MRLLLLLGSCLLPALASAQTTVSGRVVEAKSGDALAGATILQTGTTNGVPSNAEGNFTLAIPVASDSIALTFSLVGYTTQRRRVAPGSTSIVRLVPDVKFIDCGMTAYPRAEIGLASGVRYAPLGGTLKLYGSRLVRLPLNVTVGYQTNFRRNHALTALLELPPLWQRRFTVAEALTYERLQAAPANSRFSSYKMMVSLGSFRSVGSLPSFLFLLGGGYARRQSLALADAVSTSGFGYSLGLQTHYTMRPFRLAGAVQATRWPGYWQWQARLAHPFGQGSQCGVVFQRLPHYTELSVVVSHAFY